MLGDPAAGFGDAFFTGEHRRHCVGAGDDDFGVTREHVEEAVFLRHDRPNDVHEFDAPSRSLLPPLAFR